MAKFSKVVKDDCIACAACGAIAPDIFDFDDEGYALNVYENDNNTGTVEIDASLHSDVIDAAESCPTDAIKTSQTPFA